MHVGTAMANIFHYNVVLLYEYVIIYIFVHGILGDNLNASS